MNIVRSYKFFSFKIISLLCDRVGRKWRKERERERVPLHQGKMCSQKIQTISSSATIRFTGLTGSCTAHIYQILKVNFGSSFTHSKVRI